MDTEMRTLIWGWFGSNESDKVVRAIKDFEAEGTNAPKGLYTWQIAHFILRFHPEKYRNLIVKRLDKERRENTKDQILEKMRQEYGAYSWDEARDPKCVLFMEGIMCWCLRYREDQATPATIAQED
ncbi:uncharacterized protein BJX67DRAFT_379609 [Aspergillus lucknowensis]|uniref:Annexin n=1 Tax=Aspergillus lucknowensis TaxID=176173 RepID=A0ABR4LX74_9EURO